MMMADHPERPPASTGGGRTCRSLHTAALGSLPSVALSSAVRGQDTRMNRSRSRDKGLESETPPIGRSIDMTEACVAPGASSSTGRIGNVICSS